MAVGNCGLNFSSPSILEFKDPDFFLKDSSETVEILNFSMNQIGYAGAISLAQANYIKLNELNL